MACRRTKDERIGPPTICLPRVEIVIVIFEKELDEALLDAFVFLFQQRGFTDELFLQR